MTLDSVGAMTSEDIREIVRTYHDAYCRGDVPAAAAVLDEQFRFTSPMMAFDTPRQHIAGLERFVPFITHCELISELYGDDEATLVYDLHVSLPPGTSRCAEHFRLRNGRISAIVLIFDATPWRPIIEAAATVRGPLEVAARRESA
jgi:SnoaL-like domain